MSATDENPLSVFPDDLRGIVVSFLPASYAFKIAPYILGSHRDIASRFWQPPYGGSRDKEFNYLLCDNHDDQDLLPFCVDDMYVFVERFIFLCQKRFSSDSRLTPQEEDTYQGYVKTIDDVFSNQRDDVFSNQLEKSYKDKRHGFALCSSLNQGLNLKNRSLRTFLSALYYHSLINGQNQLWFCTIYEAIDGFQALVVDNYDAVAITMLKDLTQQKGEGTTVLQLLCKSDFCDSKVVEQHACAKVARILSKLITYINDSESLKWSEKDKNAIFYYLKKQLKQNHYIHTPNRAYEAFLTSLIDGPFLDETQQASIARILKSSYRHWLSLSNPKYQCILNYIKHRLCVASQIRIFRNITQRIESQYMANVDIEVIYAKRFLKILPSDANAHNILKKALIKRTTQGNVTQSFMIHAQEFFDCGSESSSDLPQAYIKGKQKVNLTNEKKVAVLKNLFNLFKKTSRENIWLLIFSAPIFLDLTKNELLNLRLEQYYPESFTENFFKNACNILIKKAILKGTGRSLSNTIKQLKAMLKNDDMKTKMMRSFDDAFANWMLLNLILMVVVITKNCLFTTYSVLVFTPGLCVRESLSSLKTQLRKACFGQVNKRALACP